MNELWSSFGRQSARNCRRRADDLRDEIDSRGNNALIHGFIQYFIDDARRVLQDFVAKLRERGREAIDRISALDIARRYHQTPEGESFSNCGGSRFR
jgi:hypothetical protein